MSLCGKNQVLLTKDAMDEFKKLGVNKHTPKNTKCLFVGAYKLKGIKQYLGIYAMGVEPESIKIPEDSEKAHRMGGLNVLSMNAKDVAFWNSLTQFLWSVVVSTLFIFLLFLSYLFFDPVLREHILLMLGIIYKD
jgi:hypothetical protein